MSWTVTASRRVEKNFLDLPESVQLALRALLAEIQAYGPYRANWSHYSPLKGEKNAYHCHLLGGRPTFVACWRADKKNRIVEIYYVGTHENAPY